MNYLSHHPFLDTTDLDQSRELMGSLWEKHTVQCRKRGRFQTRVNNVQLGALGISYIDCVTPLQIDSSPANDHFYVHFFESGSAEYRLNGKPVCGTPRTAAVCSPSQEVSLQTEPARVLGLRIQADCVRQAMRTEWAGHWNQAAWSLALDLSNRDVAALHSALSWAATEIDANPVLLHSAAAVHLETCLKSMCLTCLLGASGYRRLDCRLIGKLEMADLEMWVHTHLNQPISVEILAERYDCSVRSVQMAFRKHRECTPMQFVRQARLWAVRRKLREREAQGVIISEIAFDYGFPHLGRFAQHYRDAFGETPSETVAKSVRS